VTQGRIGRYKIHGLIASGAQGTVYRAENLDTRRAAAIKVLHPELARDPGYVERFRREASVAAAVDHPNVCRTYEVGTDGESHFIAMEVLDTSLERLLGRDGAAADRLPIRDAALIAAQIARGLSAAHAAGITHRDIKPSNVLFSADGKARLTDFGIACGESFTTLTAGGALMGTPHYMSPELAQGGAGEPAFGHIRTGLPSLPDAGGPCAFQWREPGGGASPAYRRPAPTH